MSVRASVLSALDPKITNLYAILALVSNPHSLWLQHLSRLVEPDWGLVEVAAMQGQAMARRVKEAKKSRAAEQERKAKMLPFLTRSPKKKTLEAIPPGQSELVQQLTPQQYGELRTLFDQFDSDGSGAPAGAQESQHRSRSPTPPRFDSRTTRRPAQ